MYEDDKKWLHKTKEILEGTEACRVLVNDIVQHINVSCLSIYVINSLFDNNEAKKLYYSKFATLFGFSP